MLEFEDEKRISWKELFEHPLLKHNVAEDVKKEIEEIKHKEQDNLLQSNQINEFYLKKNRVLGADKGDAKAFVKDNNVVNQDGNKGEKSESNYAVD